ncbi:MAG: haloacid dehalogenase, type, partial [Microvirga sp.]|nr:haloacid dehalogenase, type [Microvirga sp.]
RALDYAFARFPDVDRSIRPLLLEAYRSLDAYLDVRPTLHALHAQGLRTGILSNGDPGMLKAAVDSANLAGDLDVVLSVDAVQVFKTSPRSYDLVLQTLSITADEVVFVSSNRWDIAGAAAFGFTPIWVNRLGLPNEYAELPASAVIASLHGLV